MGRRFTGIIDVNGKKIYTGDTVKMHYFWESHSLSGASEMDCYVTGIVGCCWEKFYTEQEERHYYNDKLVTEKVRYYWKTYLQEPEEELEVIS
jgi:hypothetical protein